MLRAKGAGPLDAAEVGKLRRSVHGRQALSGVRPRPAPGKLRPSVRPRPASSVRPRWKGPLRVAALAGPNAYDPALLTLPRHFRVRCCPGPARRSQCRPAPTTHARPAGRPDQPGPVSDPGQDSEGKHWHVLRPGSHAPPAREQLLKREILRLGEAGPSTWCAGRAARLGGRLVGAGPGLGAPPSRALPGALAVTVREVPEYRDEAAATRPRPGPHWQGASDSVPAAPGPAAGGSSEAVAVTGPPLAVADSARARRRESARESQPRGAQPASPPGPGWTEVAAAGSPALGYAIRGPLNRGIGL
jgi:hypothetical protein